MARVNTFQRGLLFALLSMLIFCVLPPITVNAQGAEQAEWMNNFRVRFAGDEYISDDNNNNWKFYRVNEEECPDQIYNMSYNPAQRNADGVILPDDNTVTLQRYAPSPTGCVKEGDEINNIRINSPGNAATSFGWAGNGIVELTRDYRVFTWDEQFKTYIRKDDPDGGGKCVDTIEATQGSNSIRLIVRRADARFSEDESKRSDSLISSYSGHSWVSQADFARTENGCYESETVTINNVTTDPNQLPPGVKADTTPTGEGGAGAGEQRNANSCEARSGAMGWLICPVILMTDGALNWVDTQIQALLEIDKTMYNNTGMESASRSIRNFAYIAIVPIMLVMVISTALGFEFISAYTVRRAMPRLIIAVIFITLSYPLLTFLIELANAVGFGILGLLTSPFGDRVSTLSLADLFGGSIFTSAVFLPFFIAGLAFVLWLFGWALLGGIAVAFLVLLLRQIFIVGLVLLAPLAILAWIFPGNDKLWKGWWSIFSKLLIMFPLIMAIIAVGRIFAVIIQEGGGGQLQGNVLNPLMILFAYMLPYAFIPFTFRFAGGLFATLSGMANDKSKGFFDRQKQSRAGKLDRTSKANMFRKAPEGSLRSKLNTVGATGMNINKAGFRPSKWRDNINTASGALVRQEIEKNMKENADYATWSGNDLLNAMASESKNEGELRTLLQKYGNYSDPVQMERDIARVERVRKQMSNTAFRQMTFLSATAGGTTYDRELGEGPDAKVFRWTDSMAKAAGNDDAALAYLTAQGKSSAMSAGRIDQGGASFNTIFESARGVRAGATQAQVDKLHELGFVDVEVGKKLSGEQASAIIHENIVESSGPDAIAHASNKPYAVDALVPEIQRRIATAAASGNQDAYDRELALFANIYDSMSRTAPNKAKILADKVLKWAPPVGGPATRPLPPGVEGPVSPTLSMYGDGARPLPEGVEGPVLPTPALTVQQALDARRGSEAFQATRREYRSEVGGGGGRPPEGEGEGR